MLDVKFAGCNIDDKQFQRIVEALQKHNSTVEFLNVGGNQISDTTQLAALNKLDTDNLILDSMCGSSGDHRPKNFLIRSYTFPL